MDVPGPSAIERGAHVVQLALTPVFLLSGIAALLNVFSNRLARVADQVDRLRLELEDPGVRGRPARLRRLAYLSHRSQALDVAVVLGALAGAATSLAALVLFVGALFDAPTWLLLVSFGVALTSTIGALAAYLAEMLMASRGLRAEAEGAEAETAR